MILVDEIDVKDVRFVEDKIVTTMCRLNSLRKWKPTLRLYGLKERMIYKLRKQIDFLIRVQKVKYSDVINDL